MKRYEVILRRMNGRLVKTSRPISKYAAKRWQIKWETQYDDTYYVEIRPIDR